MATGSIFHNVVIRTDEEAQALLDALEKSKQMKTEEVDVSDVVRLEDPEDIRKFLEKGIVV